MLLWHIVSWLLDIDKSVGIGRDKVMMTYPYHNIISEAIAKKRKNKNKYTPE